MIRYAIFDLDGTLTDSNPFWDKAPDAWLETVGKKAKPGLARQIFSMTLPEAAEYMTAEYDLTQSPGEIMDGVNREMERFYLNEVPLKEGVRDLITILKNKGIHCAVASVTDRYLVEKVLDRFDLLQSFSAIVTTDEVGAGKMEPDIYLKAAEMMGGSPGETLVFEDALHALHTAKKAGFLTVGVYDEASADLQNEVREASDIYLGDFSDLTGVLMLL